MKTKQRRKLMGLKSRLGEIKSLTTFLTASVDQFSLLEGCRGVINRWLSLIPAELLTTLGLSRNQPLRSETKYFSLSEHTMYNYFKITLVHVSNNIYLLNLTPGTPLTGLYQLFIVQIYWSLVRYWVPSQYLLE